MPAAGAYDVTIAFRNVASSRSTNANGSTWDGAFGNVVCGTGCNGSSYRLQPLNCFDCTVPSAFNMTTNLVVDQAMTISVMAGIQTDAYAQGTIAALNGPSSAAASATATIGSITATPVS